MSNVKEAQEIAKVIVELIKPVQIWSSKSQLRAGIALICFTLLLEICLFASWHFMIHVSRDEGKSRSEEIQRMTSASVYLVALDTINLCLDNSDDSRRLRKWYCERATDLYKSHSHLMLPDRVEEVVARSAYGAMKVDMADLLRKIEFDKMRHTPETPIKKALANEYFYWASVALLMVIDFVLAYWLGFFRTRRNAPATTKLMY